MIYILHSSIQLQILCPSVSYFFTTVAGQNWCLTYVLNYPSVMIYSSMGYWSLYILLGLEPQFWDGIWWPETSNFNLIVPHILAYWSCSTIGLLTCSQLSSSLYTEYGILKGTEAHCIKIMRQGSHFNSHTCNQSKERSTSEDIWCKNIINHY